MTSATPISVVIASHGRPGHLRRCLTALGFQSHPRFEVIVVADGAGLAALDGWPGAAAARTLHFEAAHLARARNLGIAAAGGKVVAFLDDDAVPEPTWLATLARAFDRDGVAAAIGAVRGRNGISFQSATPAVDRHGFTRDAGTTDSPLSPGFVPKLVGTNMAVRRDVLHDLGGFDEAFRFYLEDTDLSLRLAGAGHVPAFVPEAEVQHAFAASARRTACRCPTSLFDIGRSLAIFLRKHGAPAEVGRVHGFFREEERRRLLRHMVRGGCEPRDVRRLLDDYDRGVEEGQGAKAGLFPAFPPPPDFTPFPALPQGAACHLLAGRPWNRRTLSATAARLARDGHVVTLMLFSPTSLFHHRGFDPAGYWVQTGGTLGRSERSEPLLRATSLADRVRREWSALETRRKPPGTIMRSQIPPIVQPGPPVPEAPA